MNAKIHETTDDRVLWREDLETKFKVHSETIRRWLRSGKLPSPDVNITRCRQGWKVSTLRAAGINLE